MAVEHHCQRHGRPAVASRVRLRPDGTQEVEYLCELDLAEERMSSRLGGRSLFDDFFSDFFGESPPAAPARASRRRRGRSSASTSRSSSATPPVELLQRAAQTALEWGSLDLDTRPPAATRALQDDVVRHVLQQIDADPDAIAAQLEEEAEQGGADGRRALALARREGRPARRLRRVARARGLVRRPGARAARARARSARAQAGQAAAALRRLAHEAARRRHPRRRVGRQAARDDASTPTPRRVRPRPDAGGARGQARPRDRPRGRDRPDDRDPLATDEEQPRPDRRAGRRQDRDRRGDRPADRERRGARDTRRAGASSRSTWPG